ncbi:MAG: carbohydrate porin, partial [Phycisphaerales bacterium]
RSRGSASVPEDSGISLIADQDFGERWKVFARAAWSDADATGVRTLLEGGATYEGLMGSRSVTGAALARADFSRESRREETIAEVFQRWQVTDFTQFTLGVQVIFDPTDAPDDDVLGVFSARLRVTF